MEYSAIIHDRDTDHGIIMPMVRSILLHSFSRDTDRCNVVNHILNDLNRDTTVAFRVIRGTNHRCNDP